MSSRPHKKVKVAIPVTASSVGKNQSLATSHNNSTKPTISTTGKERAPQKDPSSLPRSSVKGKEREEVPQLPASFKVVAGSYEKLLYGLDGSITIGVDSKLEFQLKPIFIFPAHVSCIKAVAASPQGGKWLATGSADEIVKVWDLRRRKEIGGLMHHEGSITHLVFPSRSHLLSASEDGTLCLFRARDWAVLRSLKGHKGRVNAVAVHPSGKVALSVGKDRALRMWDLMRGKGVASTKLGNEGEIVRWSTDGSKFGVQFGPTIQIYSTNMDLLWTITHTSRIHDIKFAHLPTDSTEVLLVGAEDKKTTVYLIPKDSNESPTIISYMIGHSNRIKAVETLQVALPSESGRSSTTIVCTASSDGFINVYDMADILAPADGATPKNIQPLTNYNSKGTRLTCITIADADIPEVPAANKKRKKVDEDEEHSEHDEDEDAWGGIEDQEEHLEEEGEDEDEGEEEDEYEDD